MAQPTTPQRPIGWWLKQADDAITKLVNDVQTANGVSRTEWQVLNTLHEGGGTNRERLLDTLRPFVDAQGIDAILRRFADRAWIAEATDRGVLELTDEGRRMHGTILVAQQEIRHRAMRGISENDYAIVIRVLEQIVINLKE